MVKFIRKNRLALFVYFQCWMFYFSVLHSDDSPLMSAGSGMVDFVVSDRRVFFNFYFFIMGFLHNLSWSSDFFPGNRKKKRTWPLFRFPGHHNPCLFLSSSSKLS